MTSQVGDVLQQKDACNIFLVSDRRLDHAFTEDMRAQGVFGRTEQQQQEEEEAVVVPEVNKEEKLVAETTLEQPGGGRVAGGRDERARGEGLQLPTCDDPGPEIGWRSGGKPPPAGAATKNFIRETLPELQRMSKTLKR